MPKSINVYALPVLLPEVADCADRIAVVIDVLRATTSMIYGLHHGVREVIPVLDIETAIKLRRSFPDGSTFLGGERQGKRIEGFDLGNSPNEFQSENVKGKRIIVTTTNGTVAINAARKYPHLFLAGFVNAGTVVDRLSSFDNIDIICSGSDGQYTEEDLLLAGLLVERLCRRSMENLSPPHFSLPSLNVQAVTARENWTQCFPRENPSADDLCTQLKKTRGAKVMLALGIDAEILVASQLDSLDTVPRFDDNRIIIEPVA